MFRNLSPGAVGIKGSLEETLKLAADAGFEGLDLPIGEVVQLIDEKGADHVKALYADAGLQVGGFGCPVDFRKDEAAYEEGLAKLPKLAEAAAAVGCTRMPTWIMPWSDDRPFDENFELHRRRLRGIAEIVKDHGIRFGLEFVGPKTSRQDHTHEFIYDMDGMLKLCDAIGTGNMGLLLDCWHWYTSHGTADDLAKLTNDMVVYVHVNDAPAGVAVDEQIDNVRALPGETGVIDIGAFMRALDAAGYDGPITAEPFSKAVGKMENVQTAKVVAESLNKIWSVAGLS